MRRATLLFLLLVVAAPLALAIPPWHPAYAHTMHKGALVIVVPQHHGADRGIDAREIARDIRSLGHENVCRLTPLQAEIVRSSHRGRVLAVSDGEREWLGLIVRDLGSISRLQRDVGRLEPDRCRAVSLGEGRSLLFVQVPVYR